MKDNDSPLNLFHKNAKGDLKADQSAAVDRPVSEHIQNSMTMMSQMKQMKEDIDTQLEKVIAASGFTKSQVWEFLENPRNLTPEQLEKAAADYMRLSEKVSTSTAVLISDVTDEQQKGLRSKEQRRGKFTGARRRWLSTY
jgi:hypothetical protein